MTQTITIKDPKAPASPAQLSYLTSLVKDRECPTVAERLKFAQAAGFLAKGTASKLIDEALKAPKKKTPTTGTFVVEHPPLQQTLKQTPITQDDGSVAMLAAPAPVEIPEAPAFGYYLITEPTTGKPVVYYWDVTGKDYFPTLRRLSKVTQYDGKVKGKWTKVYASSYTSMKATATYKPCGPKSTYPVKTSTIHVPKVLADAVAAGAKPMTMTQAAAQGHMLGFCIRCGATLTDPQSVADGIGPVCKTYWF